MLGLVKDVQAKSGKLYKEWLKWVPCLSWDSVGHAFELSPCKDVIWCLHCIGVQGRLPADRRGTLMVPSRCLCRCKVHFSGFMLPSDVSDK